MNIRNPPCKYCRLVRNKTVSVIAWGRFARNIIQCVPLPNHNTSGIPYNAHQRAATFCRAIQVLRHTLSYPYYTVRRARSEGSGINGLPRLDSSHFPENSVGPRVTPLEKRLSQFPEPPDSHLGDSPYWRRARRSWNCLAMETSKRSRMSMSASSPRGARRHK